MTYEKIAQYKSIYAAFILAPDWLMDTDVIKDKN